MPVNFLNLFCIADTKGLVKHALSLEPFQLPSFFQGESPPTAFTLLTQNAAGGSAGLLQPWTKIAPGSYSLKIGIYLASDGTLLAFQDTWADDAASFSKSAVLTYASAAITTALAAAGGSSIACILEVEIKDATGNCYKPLQANVTLYKQFITPSSATVPATEVAAVQSWVAANFAKRYRQAGEFDIWITPNGTACMVLLDDDLQFKITPLPAAP